METPIFSEYLMTTLVTWIGGLALGGGIGYLTAILARFIIGSIPAKRWIIALVPWRTLTFILILIIWSPLLTIWLGLGILTGMLMVGLTILLLAWSITTSTLLDSWFPPIFHVLLTRNARNLLFLALFATLGSGLVGGSGVGDYIMQQINLLKFSNMLQGILLLGCIALILDIILGIVEYWTSIRSSSIHTM